MQVVVRQAHDELAGLCLRFGLGLGFFIAKTLLERSGAKLSLINQAPPLHGATITVTWNRGDFETPLAPPPLEAEAVSS